MAGLGTLGKQIEFGNIRCDSISVFLRKQYSNLDFVKRSRLTATSVRFIRSKGQQISKQKPREYSSISPFEGYVPPPSQIGRDVLAKTFMFTAAVSSVNSLLMLI